MTYGRVRWHDRVGTVIALQDARGCAVETRATATWLIVDVDGPICCDRVAVWHESVSWL